MNSCKTMKTVIEKIISIRSLTDNFESGQFHLRINNEPYMPLTIERHEKQVSVTHYFEQNGDLVPDPDMEFVIGADGNWYPVGIQFAVGVYRRARWFEGGQSFVNPKECREQISFSNQWAKNIKLQGYISADITPKG